MPVRSYRILRIGSTRDIRPVSADFLFSELEEVCTGVNVFIVAMNFVSYMPVMYIQDEGEPRLNERNIDA